MTTETRSVYFEKQVRKNTEEVLQIAQKQAASQSDKYRL